MGFEPFPELAGSKIPRIEEKTEAMIEAVHDCAISEGVIDPYLDGCIDGWREGCIERGTERCTERGTEREASTRSTGRDETRPRVVRGAVVRF